MLLKRIGLNNDINKRKVKVYDTVNKLLLGEFETCREAALFTGLRPAHISAIINGKRKNKTNKLGTTITMR